MDADLSRLRYEDELTVLAARRGLLTRFVVKSLRGYALSPELVVDVPEFACVGLLMRRIFRAKLQRGEFLPPARFVLRRHRLEAGQLVGMETLAPQSETGDEHFLFNLGYRAPGPHEVYMQSAPRSNDREQQQRLLGAGVAAAEGARVPYSTLPGIAPAAGSFQQLLLGPPGGSPASVGASYALAPRRTDQVKARKGGGWVGLCIVVLSAPGSFHQAPCHPATPSKST